MLAFLPLIQKLILEYMIKKTHAGFSFNFQAVGLFAAAGILMMLMFLFMLFALQSFTAEMYGEPASWLLTAAVTFLLVCLLYGAACYSKRKKAIMHTVKDEVEDKFGPYVHIIEQIIEPVKDHPLAAIVLAGLAGVMAGDKLHRTDGTHY